MSLAYMYHSALYSDTVSSTCAANATCSTSSAARPLRHRLHLQLSPPPVPRADVRCHLVVAAHADALKLSAEHSSRAGSKGPKSIFFVGRVAKISTALSIF